MTTRVPRHVAGSAVSEEVMDQMERGELWGRDGVVDAPRRRATDAFVEAGARDAFYHQTLLSNVAGNHPEPEPEPEPELEYDRIDEYLLLGDDLLRSHASRLKELGIKAVVTLVPLDGRPLALWSMNKIADITCYEFPTSDYVFDVLPPSMVTICDVLDFIEYHALRGGSTYIQCKAGRAKSATIALCYLVKYRKMTPQSALDHVLSVRPRLTLALAQIKAVEEFSRSLARTRSLQN